MWLLRHRARPRSIGQSCQATLGWEFPCVATLLLVGYSILSGLDISGLSTQSILANFMNVALCYNVLPLPVKQTPCPPSPLIRE